MLSNQKSDEAARWLLSASWVCWLTKLFFLHFLCKLFRLSDYTLDMGVVVILARWSAVSDSSFKADISWEASVGDLVFDRFSLLWDVEVVLVQRLWCSSSRGGVGISQNQVLDLLSRSNSWLGICWSGLFVKLLYVFVDFRNTRATFFMMY